MRLLGRASGCSREESPRERQPDVLPISPSASHSATVARVVGPLRLDDHDLEREWRVLRLAEALIRQRADEREDDDGEQHDRAVLQRPFGQVEARVRRADRLDGLHVRFLADLGDAGTMTGACTGDTVDALSPEPS